ncbi:aspartate/glutamate racemase family protein [Trichothermofontia sp.]
MHQIIDIPEPRVLGILGGMGPLAAAAFLTRLTLLTTATCDQEHLHTVLWSDPTVPDRTDALLSQGSSPLPKLLNGVHQLTTIGVGAIVIPCNTAHFWYNELSQATSLPILHIVEAVVASLKSYGLLRGTIGLMGTSATLKLGLYQHYLESQGYRCLLPTGEEMDRYCMPSIRMAKANRLNESYHPAAEGATRLKRRGAIAVILGCSELPLAIQAGPSHELGVPLVSSIDALAEAAIRWAKYGEAGSGECRGEIKR